MKEKAHHAGGLFLFRKLPLGQRFAPLTIFT
ncbi:MAG: hypothetical protein ACJAUE_000619 [Alcanivorax sp.]|jgi:hypothetical protein